MFCVHSVRYRPALGRLGSKSNSSVAAPKIQPGDGGLTNTKKSSQSVQVSGLTKSSEQSSKLTTSPFHSGQPLAKFNESLDYQADRRDVFKLFGIAQQIKSSGLKPDVFTYYAMFKAFAAAGRYHTSISLLEDMKVAGVEPDLACYNAVLKVKAEKASHSGWINHDHSASPQSSLALIQVEFSG